MSIASSSMTTARPARKNPLRIAAPGGGDLTSAGFMQASGQPSGLRRAASPILSPEDLRRLMISDFSAWLRTQTNKHKRPYQEDTISDYAETAHVLSTWMEKKGIDGDFTACDMEMLNDFFAGYRESHTQGGTNTRQRNLHALFKWLSKVYDHPDPWAGEDLVRYGPGKKRPSTLALEFIIDMLEVTGGGKPKSFEDSRDHAIIRVLTEGPRRTEIAQMQVCDLSADLVARPFARVVPLKGARDYDEGRIVPFAVVTGRAVVAYLRFRNGHKSCSSPALWLGKRGPLTGSGVGRMLERRADQAGWDPDMVHQHMFRHTFANDWLAGGGSEGDLMRLMGWTDRAMVDRYAADLQVQRAVEARQRRGDMY
jgi:integrase/recombinase XerD